MPGTKLNSHGGNEKAWVWTAMDFADEEQKIEMLAIRLGSVESAQPLNLFAPASPIYPVVAALEASTRGDKAQLLLLRAVLLGSL